MEDAVIVSAVRTAVGRAPGGTLRGTRPDDLAGVVIAEVLRRAPGFEPGDVEDVILGCALPEAEQGMNVARIAPARGHPGRSISGHCEPIVLVGPASYRVWPPSG